MPRRPLAPCAHPGCPELVPHGSRGRCHRHQRARERERGSAHRRGYGRAWKATRDEHLAMEPLCRTCRKNGRVVAATDVDHIVPRVDGGTDDHSNLQSLCHRHHSEKTRSEMRQRGIA